MLDVPQNAISMPALRRFDAARRHIHPLSEQADAERVLINHRRGQRVIKVVHVLAGGPAYRSTAVASFP